MFVVKQQSEHHRNDSTTNIKLHIQCELTEFRFAYVRCIQNLKKDTNNLGSLRPIHIYTHTHTRLTALCPGLPG